MKKIKLLLISLLMSLSIFSFSQTETETEMDTVTVVKITDDMGSQSCLASSKKLVIVNTDKTKGFFIDVLFSPTVVIIKTFGFGACNENDELSIMLENGEKINIKMWNSFNCDGNAYFRLNKGVINKLRISEMVKIRIINGRNYNSFTKELNGKDKRYFIQLFNSYYKMKNK